MFQDTYNIASKLTVKRTFNGLIVLLSYWLSKLYKKPVLWGKPISIAIEPTTSCNLRCPECPSGLRKFSRPTGMLSKESFEKFLGEIKTTTTYLTFYFQGEPFLNPSFLDMVRLASNRRLYTSTSTNAHYFTDEVAKKTIESGLDRLIISIDGTTQEVYEQYRIGGKLEKVKEGTRKVLEWKKKLKSKTPHVLFQFLVVKPNEHQIDEVKQLADELGVDEVRFKTAQVYDYENGNALIPTIEKYARYRKLPNGKYAIKNTLENHCWRMWQSCVITWDGKVVPCCFDKDATHQLGDISKVSFDEVWKSKGYQAFRSQVLLGRKNVDICKNCSEGTKVWA